MPTLFVGDDDITPLTSIVYNVNRSRERSSRRPRD
jgi:hypothetical protein